MNWSRLLPPPCDDYRGSRIAVGQLKPVEVAAPPPGEIGSYLLLPLSALALILALSKTSRGLIDDGDNGASKV